MNAADSETMLAMLAERNYSLTENVDEADLVLLNTCHIREKARHKVLSRLGVLKELKAQKPGMTIAVSGCVAQAEGQKLLKAAPQIDVLFGPGKINELCLERDKKKIPDNRVTVGTAQHMYDPLVHYEN
jgi:tRNA-2-methylthio-N6-dimethylallyladenosine synthase